MTCLFHSDLTASQQAIEGARRVLLAVVDPLGRQDLDRARKGGWPVRRVLEHVIYSEQLYAQAAAYLCGSTAPERPPNSSPASGPEARTMLLDSRKALLNALAQLDMDPSVYETFYEVRRVGHEEYSVLSLLENVAHHDHEHAAQVKLIIDTDT